MWFQSYQTFQICHQRLHGRACRTNWSLQELELLRTVFEEADVDGDLEPNIVQSSHNKSE